MNMKIAIYSRKSKYSDKGDSIENQIQLCKEYALKNFDIQESDIIIFEDEGFSGGDTDRPQFQQMLQDAKEKKFDVLICYRLDRVSRNIADFSALIEELQEHNIAFVSIREQFDTSTPLGRAMMYIASVFAQLERETIAERIRDNMHELAKTGRWLGGAPPLGFELERVSQIDEELKERSLVKLNPVPDEMKQVEHIYQKYLELGSIHQVRKYLIQNDIRTKKGAYFSSRAISDILRSPAYVKADTSVIEYLQGKGISIAGQERVNGKIGILIYNKRNKKGIKNEPEDWIGAVAKHEGIILPEKWLKVQAQLDKNSMTLPREGTSQVALLSGILRCAKCGSAMNVMYGNKRKDGVAPHYYICNLKTFSAMDKCQNENVRGDDIEHTIIDKLLELSASRDSLLHELEVLRKSDKQHSDSKNVLDKLKNRKKELLEEINNLVSEISKSAVASKYILPQIEAKDAEVKRLDKEITNLEAEQDKIKNETEEFDLVINNILNFKNVVDNLSNREKKGFLQTIIDKVYWDGDKQEVTIKLFTGSTNVSQFHPAPSWPRDENAIVLYQQVESTHRYKDYPEKTLGQKIRKQRLLKGLTAKELGELCGCSENTIYCYESGTAIPKHDFMKRIITALDVNIDYFEDDYYSFILSDEYTSYLKRWRKENTNNIYEIKKKLGVSYVTYLAWEKGQVMNRIIFNKIKDKLF